MENVEWIGVSRSRARTGEGEAVVGLLERDGKAYSMASASNML